MKIQGLWVLRCFGHIGGVATREVGMIDYWKTDVLDWKVLDEKALDEGA